MLYRHAPVIVPLCICGGKSTSTEADTAFLSGVLVRVAVLPQRRDDRSWLSQLRRLADGSIAALGRGAARIWRRDKCSP
jgi:hypothetical protein|eukprot:COSAG02_NODE_8791_length_2443_cov_3.256399_2_plen_79_part_00